MNRHTIRRTLENVLIALSDDNRSLINQRPYEDLPPLDIEDVNRIYSAVASVFGADNVLIFGGAALQRYCQHKPKDVDLIVNGDIAANIENLSSRGFTGVNEKTLKVFFNSKVYESGYPINGNKIKVEYYSPEGLLGKNDDFRDVMKISKESDYRGLKIHYADPYTLSMLKYRAWKNRLANGRADKDLIDLEKAGIFYNKTNDPPYQKLLGAYTPGMFSRLKSIFSETVHILHQNYLRQKQRV